MDLGTQTEHRRSQRVLLNVRVIARGVGRDNKPFREETHTLVVNAHGGLLVLATSVIEGQRLVLVNMQTKEEQECHVVHLGPNHAGKTQIGFAFARPAPGFWHINFPPDDWKPLLD